MDKKELIKYATIILGCIVILMVLENAIRGTKQVIDKVGNKIETKKAQKQYERTETYQEEDAISQIVSRIEQLIVSGDFDTLYAMTDEDYLDFRFEKKKDDFVQYMKSFTKDMKSIELRDYSQYGKKYYLNNIMERESDAFPFRTMLILEDENDLSAYKIVFDNYQDIKKVHYGSSYNAISASIYYQGNKDNEIQFAIDFSSPLKEETTFSLTRATVMTTKYTSFEAADLEKIGKITIKPGETVRKIISFKGKAIYDYPISRMEIGVAYGDKNESLSISFPNR